MKLVIEIPVKQKHGKNFNPADMRVLKGAAVRWEGAPQYMDGGIPLPADKAEEIMNIAEAASRAAVIGIFRDVKGNGEIR
jgi:hypothetical protein